MILIITHKEDFTADFVINKLNDRGIDYYRLNCEDIDTLNYSFERNFNFNIENHYSFNTVWFRRTKLPNLNIENIDKKLFVLEDFETLFQNIYNLVKAEKWLSHPNAVYKSENKIYQLKIANEIGFNIPDTLVTNQHFKLRQFIEKHNENVIIKPIRQGRIKVGDGFKTIFTNKLNQSILKELENFELTPCIFQEYIEKQYELRVTVVNDKVFTAKIDSQNFDETKTDWRKKKTPIEKYILPKDIVEKCLAITKMLNLSFGAIDLIKNNKGEYYFLEINPNGQWAWLELEAGLEISDEIINFLTT